MNSIYCCKLQISDFGLSKWKDYTRSHTNVAAIQGTMSHIPPEKWFNFSLRANEQFDVYSFSILFWEMLTENEAYEGCGRMLFVYIEFLVYLLLFCLFFILFVYFLVYLLLLRNIKIFGI